MRLRRRLSGRRARRRTGRLPDATLGAQPGDSSFAEMVKRIETADDGIEPPAETEVAVGAFEPGELREHAMFEEDSGSDGRLLPILLAVLFIAFVALIWVGFQVVGSDDDPNEGVTAERTTSTTEAPSTTGVTVTTAEVPVPLSSEEIAEEVRRQLDAAGYGGVMATVEGPTVYLDGVVPLDVLEDGFFEFVDGARSAAGAVPGVTDVTSRLRLKGDPIELRNALREITDEGTIVFASGSTDLTPDSLEALDRVAEAINAQPALVVLIAGHADPSGSTEFNEQLARGRAGSVFQYLVSRGVAPNRLSIVSYGELFPDAAADAAAQRRIEFEVGL